ncbi:hypothetical protein [Nocardioides sp.]|uniref:hypothetical protein n=1 Tax=Nocardioides sp. TaxID=35761 RepID=UPI0031FE7D48
MTDQVVEQRILEQSMRITATGAVTGWAALRLHGGNFFDGLARDGTTRLPVPLAAGTDRFAGHPDIVRTRDNLDQGEVVLRYGIRCTIVARAVYDEMRRIGEVREAAVVMDMAVAAGLISIPAMRTYARSRAGSGNRLVLAALELADAGSRSPGESRFRLIWELDAGWPRPLTNRSVFDLEGRFLGIPDLLDPDLGIVGEYDGADHRGIARHRRDVRREDLFRRAGLEYVEVVGSDLHDPSLIVDRMEAAKARAGRMPRLWVVGQRDGRRA